MGDVNIGEVSAPAGPLFRSKKRKIYRQRAQSPPVEVESVSSETKLDTPVSVSTGSENQHSEVEYDEDSQRSVAEALRLRKLRKHKVGGVKFQVATAAHVEESQALTTVPAQAEEGGLNVQRRFVGQTGTVAEVDKHMMAYIDSKLAERFNHTAETSSKDDKNYDDRQRTDSTASSAPIRREPTNMGRLQEIELPAAPDAQIPPRKNEIQAAKPPRKRVGRNGKEYTSKPRKRRASEDLRRDALVEAVLHENSNSIYELPPPPPTVTSGVAGWNEDADEALAEQFRREFMADVGERRTTKMVKGMDDDGLKGPKLGGSRSQRVVVRELLLRGQEGKR